MKYDTHRPRFILSKVGNIIEICVINLTKLSRNFEGFPTSGVQHCCEISCDIIYYNIVHKLKAWITGHVIFQNYLIPASYTYFQLRTDITVIWKTMVIDQMDYDATQPTRLYYENTVACFKTITK